MCSPLVSVIVPAYNAERTIQRCVESILNQTFVDIELIVVDDGSNDRTTDVIKAIQRDDNRLRLISQENAGVSSARNNGIRASCGEWLCFVDSDDVLEADALAHLLGAAVVAEVPMAVGAMAFDVVGSDGTISRGPAKILGYTGIIDDLPNRFECLYNANYVQSACSKIFSTSLIKGRRICFDERLSSFEDFVFVMDCLAASPAFAVTDEVCYRYLRQLAGTGSTSFKQDMTTQMRIASESLADFYGQVLRKPFSAECLCHIVQFFVVVVNNIQKTPSQKSVAIRQLSDAVSAPVFSCAIREATLFPNGYSKIVCRLASRGRYRMVLALASCRNFVRDRYAA